MGNFLGKPRRRLDQGLLQVLRDAVRAARVIAGMVITATSPGQANATQPEPVITGGGDARQVAGLSYITDASEDAFEATTNQFAERIKNQETVQGIIIDMCKLYPVLAHDPKYPNFVQGWYSQLETVIQPVPNMVEVEPGDPQEDVQTSVLEVPKAEPKDQETDEDLSRHVDYVKQLAKAVEESVYDPKQFGPILVGAGAGELVSAGLLMSLWILKKTVKYMHDREKDNSSNEESAQSTVNTIEELDRYVWASAAAFEEASTLVLGCILKYGKARVGEISRATKLPTERVSLLVRLLCCDHEPGCYWSFANVQLMSLPPG